MAACLAALTTTLPAQDTRTLPELARWFADGAPALATAIGDETATTNLRRISTKAWATFVLDSCRLRITVSNNLGVSGFQMVTEVPLAAIDAAAVELVSRPDGWHDYVYIPAQHFVVVPARVPGDTPYTVTNGRGSFRAYVTAVPARDTEAASQLTSALTRAALLCGAPPPRSSTEP